jgi:excisionase family DNA binding protein
MLSPVTIVTQVTMLITANDIAELLGATRPWVYKLMQEHDFPKSIRIGTGVRWDSAEVYAWIDAQKAKRDTVGA